MLPTPTRDSDRWDPHLPARPLRDLARWSRIEGPCRRWPTPLGSGSPGRAKTITSRGPRPQASETPAPGLRTTFPETNPAPTLSARLSFTHNSLLHNVWVHSETMWGSAAGAWKFPKRTKTAGSGRVGVPASAVRGSGRAWTDQGDTMPRAQRLRTTLPETNLAPALSVHLLLKNHVLRHELRDRSETILGRVAGCLKVPQTNQNEGGEDLPKRTKRGVSRRPQRLSRRKFRPRDRTRSGGTLSAVRASGTLS
jgi:hypothetical protein